MILTNADGQIAATDKFHLEFLDDFAEELPPDCKLILQRGERDD